MVEPGNPVSGLILDQVDALLGSPFDEDVATIARHCLVDWFGCVLAAGSEPLSLLLADDVREQGAAPVATVVGVGIRTSARLAALVNGAVADVLDYSEVNRPMNGHALPAIVAAALAVGEEQGSSGSEVLRAVVRGVETACRVGSLLDPDRMKFHPTGIVAPFGAAAAAAHLKGLDRERLLHALGLAATQAAGLRASGGTMGKPFHSGAAAHTGIMAVALAQRGFTANTGALEAGGGFLENHTQGFDAGSLSASAGRHHVRDLTFKSFAACVLTHGTIRNMLELRRRSGFAPGGIVGVELCVPTVHLSVCDIPRPRTGLELKFSLRGCGAMALLGYDLTALESYSTGSAAAPEVVRLIGRIRVTGVSDMDVGSSAAVVTLDDGTKLTYSDDQALRPDPDLERQDSILHEKFRMITRQVLTTEAGERILDLLGHFDAVDDVRVAMKLVRDETGGPS